jgi:hypothetical protein
MCVCVMLEVGDVILSQTGVKKTGRDGFWERVKAQKVERGSERNIKALRSPGCVGSVQNSRKT